MCPIRDIATTALFTDIGLRVSFCFFSTLSLDSVSHFLPADSLWWCAPPPHIKKSEKANFPVLGTMLANSDSSRFPWVSMGIINTTFSLDGSILRGPVFHSWSCHKLSGRHYPSRTSLSFLLREPPTMDLGVPLLQMNVPWRLLVSQLRISW